MKLGEFIERFSHNNLIRLYYKSKGGYERVSELLDDLSMDWEVNRGRGIYRHYINNEVLCLVGMYTPTSNYQDVINIVIERLEKQPFIEEIPKENSFKDESI